MNACRSHGGQRWVNGHVLACILPIAAAGCASAPAFVPRPGEVYQGFSAIADPKPEVAVGALWVQGYGPFGEGAAADNLVTLRGLSGFSATGDLQLSLTLGLGSLLHIDPQYRTKISARFSDLSVVRVKDVAKLSGPSGQPRIYEALKAGTITVTADKSLGLDFDAQVKTSHFPVLGRGDTGRTQSLTIDGKDMYLAYRVVTPAAVRGRVETARIVPTKDGGGEASVHGYRIRLQPAGDDLCEKQGSRARAVACSDAGNVRFSLSEGKAPGTTADADAASVATHTKEARLPLPLPISTSPGRLFTVIALRARLQPGAPGRVGMRGKVEAALIGEELRPFSKPRATTW